MSTFWERALKVFCLDRNGSDEKAYKKQKNGETTMV